MSKKRAANRVVMRPNENTTSDTWLRWARLCDIGYMEHDGRDFFPLKPEDTFSGLYVEGLDHGLSLDDAREYAGRKSEEYASRSPDMLVEVEVEGVVSPEPEPEPEPEPVPESVNRFDELYALSMADMLTGDEEEEWWALVTANLPKKAGATVEINASDLRLIDELTIDGKTYKINFEGGK